MKRLISAIIFLGWASAGSAEMAAPDVVVRTTIDTVLASLSSNRDQYLLDKSQLFEMVDQVIMPHIDLERTYRLVLGSHSRSLSPEKQTEFNTEFKNLLLRTYGTAFYDYTDQQITIKPFENTDNEDRVTVYAELVRTDAPNVVLEFKMTNRGLPSWKVYDLVTEGVSLISNYRSQYDGIISRNGIDALIAQLADKNKEASTTQ
ncbi:MAG: ABC transporter substrate-binding protein [Proteobacteria bacterium]|jgi:phospholipid transport system substrate-binding protein|nr:ABC transporter substrate-binding protein [Pseudomonadota bacterium]